MGGTLCVIPARYSSIRLPGKPLLLLKNIPIVMWVYRAAIESQAFDKVLVATDDKRIKDTVEKFGGEAVLTSETHRTGTDRVWEVASSLDYDIVVNLQGDEPFIKPEILRVLVENINLHKDADIATPVRKARNIEEVLSKSTAKVVIDKEGFALYFSRAPIPYPRDNEMRPEDYFLHVGIYAYKKKALKHFVHQFSPVIERIESLEQLRALYHGLKIKVVEVEYNGVSIDTEEDYRMAKKIIGEDYDWYSGNNKSS